MLPTKSKTVLLRPEVQERLDTIVDYLKDTGNTMKLDKDTQGMHDRMQFAYDHMRSYWPESGIVKAIMKKFGVSQRTAYNDIDNAEYIHGSVGQINLTFHVQLLLDISMKNIKMAMDDKDTKALSKAIEARVKILKLVEEDKSIPWELLQPSQYTMIINNFNGNSAIKLDLNKVEELSSETVIEIQRQLEQKFDAELIDILTPSIDESSDKGTAAE